MMEEVGGAVVSCVNYLIAGCFRTVENVHIFCIGEHHTKIKTTKLFYRNSHYSELYE